MERHMISSSQVSDDQAELQARGGASFFETPQALTSGKRVNWPLAKLSASAKTLQLQTPFGTYVWERADRCLTIQRTGLFGTCFNILAGDASPKDFWVFVALPWKAKMVAGELKRLGYDVRS
jgi:hypothetical protein